MRKLFFISSILFLFMPKDLRAQELNNYKYVIVPKKFGFLAEPDKYQLNSMTVFLFNKYGFEAIMEGEALPEDLKKNPCSALHADVLSDSGMFSMITKVKVVLKNCTQQTLFESKEGRSKQKEYKFSFQEALRDAFTSIEMLNYKYEPASEEIIESEEKPELITNINAAYTFENQEYILSKKEEHWILKRPEVEKPVAFLYKTHTTNFVFRSEEITGTAYFDNQENLVVEYFDENAGKLEKRVYEKSK